MTCTTCNGAEPIDATPETIRANGSVVLKSCPDCQAPPEEVLRLRRVEAAARELVAALPTCGVDVSPHDVTYKACGRLALCQEAAPYDTPYRCEEHREGSDEVQWADAARALSALVAEEQSWRGGG